jgi:hypothetical protein
MWVGAKAEIAAEILPRDWEKTRQEQKYNILQKRIVDALSRRAEKIFKQTTGQTKHGCRLAFGRT